MSGRLVLLVSLIVLALGLLLASVADAPKGGCL